MSTPRPAFPRPLASPSGSILDAVARGAERRIAHRGALLGAAGRPSAGFRLREAGPADAAALRDLATLDEAALPAAPHLVALVDGRVVAAIGVLDRRVVADPFVRTAEAVEGLQAVAAELRGPLLRARRTHPVRAWARRLRVRRS